MPNKQIQFETCRERQIKNAEEQLIKLISKINKKLN